MIRRREIERERERERETDRQTDRQTERETEHRLSIRKTKQPNFKLKEFRVLRTYDLN